jgi:hypothetical protein
MVCDFYGDESEQPGADGERQQRHLRPGTRIQETIPLRNQRAREKSAGERGAAELPLCSLLSGNSSTASRGDASLGGRWRPPRSAEGEEDDD